MQLVIVESPAKGNTIKRFLGSGYRVLASYGHMRDLPEDEFGIDVKNNFEPKYVIISKAKKNVALLKKDVEKASQVILATDEDREGEAIAWHLVQALGLDEVKSQKSPKENLPEGETSFPYGAGRFPTGQAKVKSYERIVFHEITKQAIEKALKNPRDIDINLVDAQQARRILDRIVGYKLSPFLWKKVARGLSAGRVQSVAVRLVCEREGEIEKFKPEEYWTIIAQLKKTGDGPLSVLQSLQRSDLCQLEAILIQKDGKILDKLAIKNKKGAERIVKDLRGAEYEVINVEKKEIKRNPLPPFTTSALQQEAWQRFRFPAKFTMQIAQKLYETGKITYHRTDSLNLSDLSLFAAKKWICQSYGENYWAGYLRKFKTKTKGAQEAHEAIRPTYADKIPEKLKLEGNQFKLYDLIWRRFIACQMAQAAFDSTAVEISAKIPNSKSQIPKYIFKATGQVLKFEGFLKVYPIKYEENELPPLKINEILELIKLIPSQHFTQPLPRYNEASLIKVLEENGIGRPSTYAPILSIIQERNYIEKDEQKRFRPTEIGTVVNDILVAHFPEIVDIKFTAKMEENFDEIAEGQRKWVPVIKEFYEPFEENLENKYKEVSKKDITEKPTEKTCPKCGAPLLIRLGKYGKFYACSKFPKCRYTESLEKNTLGIKCPKCKKGEVVEKRTKRRKIFYGCANWPKCDFALWDRPTGEFCPKCKSLLVQTIRRQIRCSNKECDYKIEKLEKI